MIEFKSVEQLEDWITATAYEYKDKNRWEFLDAIRIGLGTRKAGMRVEEDEEMLLELVWLVETLAQNNNKN